MKMEFSRIAIGNRLIVKLDKVKPTANKINGQTVSKSGNIVLPDNVAKRLSEDERRGNEGMGLGVVINMGHMAYHGLGDGRKWCQVGDRVCFKRYAGIDVTDYDNRADDDESIYRCIDDEDVMAIVKD